MTTPCPPKAPLPTDRHITYQIQRRTCGKQKQQHCRACEQGIGHGPYVYAYWRDESGRLHSAYIGKASPNGVPDGQPENLKEVSEEVSECA